jgi:hypothetical protein
MGKYWRWHKAVPLVPFVPEQMTADNIGPCGKHSRKYWVQASMTGEEEYKPAHCAVCNQKASGDEMVVFNPKTGKDKVIVDKDNTVRDVHECVFKQFHELEPCFYCGKLLGDLIAESDPMESRPIVINPNIGVKQ